MWHVSSRSGVATLRTAIHLLLTYLLTYRCRVVPGLTACSLAVVREMFAAVRSRCGSLHVQLGLLHTADLSTAVLQTHPTLRHQKRKRWQSSPDCKGKGSPYSITERRVPELIPVLGSQPAGDVSHKPGGRLPLLSARPAVTPATNFAAWWTETRWVWTVCLGLLLCYYVTARQRRGCDLNPRTYCAWV